MNDSTLTPLTHDEITDLLRQYPNLPAEYTAHMERFGWGKLLNGCMLYSGPILPDEVYGDSLSASSVLLFGDDTCGYCFGYDPAAQRFGEFSPDGNWEPWSDAQGFGDYLSSN